MLWSPGDSARQKLLLSLSYALEAGPYPTQPHTRLYHTAHSRAATSNCSSPRSHDVPMIPPPVALLLLHVVMLLLQTPKRPVSSFIGTFPAAHCGPWTPLVVDTSVPVGDVGGTAAWCKPRLHQPTNRGWWGAGRCVG